MLIASVGPAHAEPGEPPITLLSPAPGASVAADIEGIPASFTCPPTSALPPFGSETAYGADLAGSPALAANGRLADAVGGGEARPRSGDPSTCDTRLGGGGAPRPQVTPGTYFWQAWRYCDSCASGYETSEVRSFTVGISGRVDLKAPRRAYSGYAIAFGLKTSVDAVYDEEGVQRSVGGGWKTVATRRGGALIGKLPRGRQRIRGFVRSGGDTVVSSAQRISVLKGRNWKTNARDDGLYRDSKRPSVRLRVSGGGRTVKRLRADIPVDCVTSGAPGGITPDIRTATLPPLQVAPDGGIAFYGKYRGAELTLIARLRKRRLRAETLRYSDGPCVGSIAIDARRR